MASGSSQQFSYALGTTLIAVPVGSTATPVVPPSYCNGLFIKYQSGGTLALVNQLAQALTAGYIFGTEVLSIDGPSKFFLAASGTTSVAAIVFKYGSGYSLIP